MIYFRRRPSLAPALANHSCPLVLRAVKCISLGSFIPMWWPYESNCWRKALKSLFCALGFGLLLSWTAFAQAIGEGNHEPLKGPVKSVRVERSKIFEKDGKSMEGPRVLSAEYVFDSRGRLVESHVCNHDGSPYAKYQAIYNDKGKAEETYHNPKGDLLDKMVYSYGPDGRLVEKTVEKTKKSMKGKSVFSYDDKGRIIEKIHTSTNDPDGFKLVYSYDDAQSKIEETSYDLKGKLKSRTTHRYDGQWRLVEQEFDLSPGTSGLSNCTFVYDANGNIAEETLFILDAISKWRYEYQVDSHNNWIRRTTVSAVIKNGKLSLEPIEATYRTITYDASSTESPASRPSNLASIVATDEANSQLQGDATKRQQPVYPANARRQLQSGKIIVQILVDEGGRVISARAIPSKAELLRDAATFAAWGWTFNPTVSGGVAVWGFGTVTFNFTL